MSGVLTLDLIRHGQPAGGSRMRGRTDDPLTDTGWQQMRRALEGRQAWDLIVSSPLQRCAAFAEELAKKQGVPLSIDPGIVEIDFGDWDGQDVDTLWREEGEALGKFWMDPSHNTPPNGESLDDMWLRIAKSLQHVGDNEQDRRVLMVTHGGVIKLLLAQLMEMPLANMTRFDVPYAGFSTLRLSARFTPELLTLNG